MAKSTSNLTLRGGTHNPMVPSLSFLQQLAPYFSGSGEPVFEANLRRHGFYPAGGGEVLVKIAPPAQGVSAINLMQRGALIEAYAECLDAGLPRGVAERELDVLQKALNFSEEQLMIPMALAALRGEKSQYFATELTDHTRTNAMVIERFLPVKFVIAERDGGVLVSV